MHIFSGPLVNPARSKHVASPSQGFLFHLTHAWLCTEQGLFPTPDHSQQFLWSESSWYSLGISCLYIRAIYLGQHLVQWCFEKEFSNMKSF